jgi:N-acetylglutamate synthase-like GNAT family acetyltransferase
MKFTMLLQETKNRLSEGRFTLVDVVDQDDWKAYHHIRRTVLFDARGVSGYDANHPDEHSPINHPLLLKHDGRNAVGTVRLDQRSAGGGITRLVAIQSDYQRCGLGRLMMGLIETRALSLAMDTLYVSSAPDAVGFYERIGFQPFPFDPSDLTGIAAGCVQMRKPLGGI